MLLRFVLFLFVLVSRLSQLVGHVLCTRSVVRLELQTFLDCVRNCHMKRVSTLSILARNLPCASLHDMLHHLFARHCRKMLFLGQEIVEDIAE